MADRWIVTTDRSGVRAYASPGGSVVCKDGCGSTPVTVYYPGFVDWFGNGSLETGMTDTVREAKAWADAAEGIAP